MNRKNTRAVAALLCGALLALVLLSGCSAFRRTCQGAGEKAISPTLDTVTYIYSYAGDSAERFRTVLPKLLICSGEYHQLFDIYHEYSGINNLCTVNKMAGGEAVTVDARLIEFLLYAKGAL